MPNIKVQPSGNVYEYEVGKTLLEVLLEEGIFVDVYKRQVYDGDYDDAWDDYMIYGGLPQVVGFQSERQKADYLKNIFANVYLKDVIERNKIQSVDEIGILVDILASAIGAPTNPSKIANTFASERQMTYANKTISNHIDHLADAFLISKASRYNIKGRKYIGANLKYYFTDLGLRNARLNFRQQEPTHIMENIVYNEPVSYTHLLIDEMVEIEVDGTHAYQDVLRQLGRPSPHIDLSLEHIPVSYTHLRCCSPPER